MAKDRKPTNQLTKGAKGHKNHGPKRHMHHNVYPKASRMALSETGVLSKYYDFESWQLACAARGKKKDIDYANFLKFVVMPMNKKKEFFANI